MFFVIIQNVPHVQIKLIHVYYIVKMSVKLVLLILLVFLVKMGTINLEMIVFNVIILLVLLVLCLLPVVLLLADQDVLLVMLPGLALPVLLENMLIVVEIVFLVNQIV